MLVLSRVKYKIEKCVGIKFELARLFNLTTPSRKSVAICSVVEMWHAGLYIMTHVLPGEPVIEY